MHEAAMSWVVAHANPSLRTLDIGGRDINGSPRYLFADYTSIDILSGPGVDVVGDVRSWQPDQPFEQVLCLEVLEHSRFWRSILRAAYRLCTQQLIVTAAGPRRLEHSGVDGGPLRVGESYRNISADELYDALSDWSVVQVDELGCDVRAVATK